MTGSRVGIVRKWFGVEGINANQPLAVNCQSPLVASGRIVLITGPSGAGKSSLLCHIGSRYDQRLWIDLAGVRLPDRAVVDCFPRDVPLEHVLAALGRVGLGEVWTYLRTPRQLSEGQRWRLRLALALHRAQTSLPTQREPSGSAAGLSPNPQPTVVLACDEFGALLDRVTASVVARVLRRSITDAPNVCALLATSHEDLERPLQPDVLVRCDFGAADVTVLAPTSARHRHFSGGEFRI